MNSNSYTLKTADWSCPSLEEGYSSDKITQDIYRFWEDAEYLVKEVKKRTTDNPHQGLILPIRQNLESLAIGRTLNDDMLYPLPGTYPVEELDSLDGRTLDLVHQPLIQANIEAIRQLTAMNEPVILEVESPFSVLAALMNPLDLYLCFMEDGECLKKILYRLACAEGEYIKEALLAGCKIISLADPVGTMNLVGETYYKEFCGASEILLMSQIDAFLDSGIVHLCKKMSQSLAIAGLITVEDYAGQITAGDYAGQTVAGNCADQTTAGDCADQTTAGDCADQTTAGNYAGQTVAEDCSDQNTAGDCADQPVSHLHVLKAMAEDPHIHFTGMTCIHTRRPDLKQSKILSLKPDIRI